MAGRTVSEPSTATATTIIVATPKPMNVLSPVNSIPAMATITVRPETSTDRPEVAAAASSAARSLRPGSALLALALEVEQRVVDADREADQQHDHADVRVERHQLARQREQSHRREHRRERQQERQAGGDERAERDDQDDQRDRDREQPGLHEVAR